MADSSPMQQITKNPSAIFTYPPLEDDKKRSHGYMGHDQFQIIETSLARRFPIYKDGDSNHKPTGGTRQLQYKLVAGEASWKLDLVESTDYK